MLLSRNSLTDSRRIICKGSLEFINSATNEDSKSNIKFGFEQKMSFLRKSLKTLKNNSSFETFALLNNCKTECKFLMMRETNEIRELYDIEDIIWNECIKKCVSDSLTFSFFKIVSYIDATFSLHNSTSFEYKGELFSSLKQQSSMQERRSATSCMLIILYSPIFSMKGSMNLAFNWSIVLIKNEPLM